MWRKNEGFLLLESMLGMVVLSTTVLMFMSGLIHLLKQQEERKIKLELAIYMNEWLSYSQQGIDDWLLEKEITQNIHVIERNEQCFSLEKKGVILTIEKLSTEVLP